MSRGERLLVALYALLAAGALYATWSHNLKFLALPGNGGAPGFIRLAYANPAAASLANDILFVCLAAFAFMLAEARRLGIRYVWVYIVLSLGIAVSVMLPLFLIARQLRLASDRPK
ncbi:MAG TPA: DUF2834 domain-containing protein [Nevskia sp.]|nr:DUF2834 domain-containing protein [Nevskia sp.]